MPACTIVSFPVSGLSASDARDGVGLGCITGRLRLPPGHPTEVPLSPR